MKGRTLTEGADYFIMYDKPIGGGAHGSVSRAWYYDPKRSVDADIAVKKVTPFKRL